MLRLLLTVTLALALSPLALAGAAPAAGPVFGDRARDHDAILAMAGNFAVTFDMRETTPLVAGYAPYPAKLSHAHEMVRALVDTPDHIILQHILVVDGDSTRVIVKHWRQDWRYEPADLLVYAAPGRWTLRPVTAAERRGAWSQTVWQTDDSPRYGGIGRWRYDDGAVRWTSDETRRLLARRDAVRGVPYDHYLGTNRHVLTPTGWVHEQDNAKIGRRDGTPTTFVHEYVVNSYVRDGGYDATAVDTYWARTQHYWAAVRARWDATIARRRGLTLAEVADTGSATAGRLLELAEGVAAGAIPSAEAERKADAVLDPIEAVPAD